MRGDFRHLREYAFWTVIVLFALALAAVSFVA